jgi:phosphotriesterase-related protein
LRRREEEAVTTLNAVNGPVRADQLGRTLMHEHLVAAFPGWEGDTRCPPMDRRSIIDLCVDRVEELKSAGFSALLDPCPNDLGRDVEIMGEVAARTGFTILFATGLYMDVSAGAYWKLRALIDPDAVAYMAEMFVSELTDGVGSTGLRPAVIKVATGKAPFTRYERMVLEAAAKASLATGAPITTHTEAVDGEAQLEILTGHGVDPACVIVGHSCGNPDHAYHRRIVDAGAYVGFDRFGIERILPDEDRVRSLVRVVESGSADRVIVSHDCVFHMRGRLFPASQSAMHERTPLHFSRNIAPKLKAAGVGEAVIDGMLRDNPRRYFEGAAALAHAA